MGDDLDVYADKLIAAGQPHATFHQELLADRDARTLSVSEWTGFASPASAKQTALNAIEPRAGVADWHQFQIEQAGFQSAFSREVVMSGLVMAAATFSDQFE